MYLVNITNPLAVTTLKDSYAKRRDSCTFISWGSTELCESLTIFNFNKIT